MKIKEITYRNRRDFQAIYECQHCYATCEGSGYDFAYFHRNVIPDMQCKSCGKTAPTNYRPFVTKYPEGTQV